MRRLFLTAVLGVQISLAVSAAPPPVSPAYLLRPAAVFTADDSGLRPGGGVRGRGADCRGWTGRQSDRSCR